MSNPARQTRSQTLANNIQNQTPQSTSTTPPRFKLTQTTTSLSAIPIPNTTTSPLTLLVHATNAFGTWGAGFAKALQTRYPSAEQVYKSWCDEKRSAPDQWPSRELVGQCLVVPPQQGDAGETWIACLFTSYGYGGRAVRGGRGGGHAPKDGVDKVMESTKGALGELREWVRSVEEGENVGERAEGGESQVAEDFKNEKSTSKVVIYSPKFNSGNFGVDWEVTAGMIREIFKDWDGQWRVLADK